MKNLFEPVLTKEEKEKVLFDILNLNNRLSIFHNGEKADFLSNFASLIKLIESYLTPKEKEIADIQEKIQALLVILTESAEYSSHIKSDLEKTALSINEKSVVANKIVEEIKENSKRVEEVSDAISVTQIEMNKSKDHFAELVKEMESLSLKAELSKAKLDTLDKSLEEAEDSKAKIILTQKNVRDLLLEVKTLYSTVFGSNEKNEETGEVEEIEGLVIKLENAYSDLRLNLKETQDSVESFRKKKEKEYITISESWNSEFNKLKDKIESLLPGALSAGLSQAYEEKKNSEIGEIKKSSLIFYCSIIGLTIISILPVSLYIFLLITGKKTVEEIALLTPSVFLAMMPLYVPCLWVAFSSDKKAKLSKRLAEEYAHKSSISKTFEGISRQVSNIADNKLSSNLESKLLYNLIQVSSENPGKLISDYDKSDHPLYEALDKGLAFSESLEKISFIPGLDKIISRVHKKNKERAEKLAEGIEAEEDLTNSGAE